MSGGVCSGVIELDEPTSLPICLDLGQPGQHRILAVKPPAVTGDRHVIRSGWSRRSYPSDELIAGKGKGRSGHGPRLPTTTPSRGL